MNEEHHDWNFLGWLNEMVAADAREVEREERREREIEHLEALWRLPVRPGG